MRTFGRYSLFLLILFFLASFKDKKQIISFSSEKFKCKYHLKNGMLNGKYQSWYSNGKKKTEGHFLHNNRKGEWKTWDSTGKLIEKRNYFNNLSYSQTLPVARRLDIPERENGYYKYASLKERDIEIEKRIWRTVSEKENPVIFRNSVLSDSIKNFLFNKTVMLFKTDDFYTSAEKQVRPEVLNRESRLIALKLKEDAFYDSDRDLVETRIIGICPVFEYQKDTMEAAWIYYPQLRKTLAGIPVPEKNDLGINNLEDLFYLQAFASEVDKEGNALNRWLRETCEIQAEVLLHRIRIQIQLIELKDVHMVL